MSQILALSFDCPSSPSILLTPPEIHEEQSYGRGFAWYNNEELSATVVKETKYYDQSTLVNSMQDFSRFHSTIFIGHIRGAAKRLVQKDTQPFSRSYAGRDWIFVHSGDLRSDYAMHIPLEKNAFFEPVGGTDSEHVFCYLLDKIRMRGARSLADVGWETIRNWLVEINQLGTANFIISDGVDIVIYNDKQSFNPLYWLRSTPPHSVTQFETPAFSIDIDNPFDIHHTFILVSNENWNQQCIRMQASQMLVLRRGKMMWDSAGVEISPIIDTSLIKPLENKVKQLPKHDFEMKILKTAGDQFIIESLMAAERKSFSIYHETIYRYQHPVDLSKHLFHLYPVNDYIQSILEYELAISVRGYGDFFEDVFGNMANFYQINTPYSELIIRSQSVVSLADNPAHQSEYLHQRRDIPLVWLPWQRQMVSPYLQAPELPESELNELIDFAMSFVKRNDYDLMEVLNDINQTIYRDFNYVSGETSIATTPYELYLTRQGVCQDFANLFICLARLLNIPARYRTGYIYTEADYDNKIQSEASHAWVEVYLPYIGWYGFDPTNGCTANDNHIRVACGRNYLDATPTKGTIYKGGGEEELIIQVKVNKVNEKEEK